jgi:hypothetical protein
VVIIIVLRLTIKVDHCFLQLFLLLVRLAERVRLDPYEYFLSDLPVFDVKRYLLEGLRGEGGSVDRLLLARSAQNF